MVWITAFAGMTLPYLFLSTSFKYVPCDDGSSPPLILMLDGIMEFSFA
jgi:hypothetical protein